MFRRLIASGVIVVAVTFSMSICLAQTQGEPTEPTQNQTEEAKQDPQEPQQAAASGEMAENPQYASWAKHQPGTTVVMEMNTVAGPQSATISMTQKLVELTKDKAVVQLNAKVNVMNQVQEKPAQKQEIPAMVPKEQADKNYLPPNVNGSVKEVGKETVQVAGKSYECTVSEFTGNEQGVQATGKLWRSDEMPGMLVKMEVQTTGGPVPTTTNMHVASVDLK